MTTLGCGCRRSCTAIAVEASIIVGILAAVLRYTAVITLTPAFLWVVLGISVGYLAITLITTVFDRCPSVFNCICRSLPALLIGILGGVLLSLVLLAITFPVTSILGAVLAGLLLFFFSLTLTTTACLILCIAGCDN